MGIDSPDKRGGRSAELQRLLDQADGKPSKAGGSASSRTPPSTRSPLRSSPASTFPRRTTSAAPTPADAPDADRQRRTQPSVDPSARLRRSALVRSSIVGTGVRRPRTDRSAEPAAETTRSRAAGPSARGTARTVPPATRTAATRSLAGRWGAAGFAPVLPEHYPPADLPVLPVLPRNTDRSMPVAGIGVDRAVTTGQATALPPKGRPGQRRTLVLAGGVAAAVVAIVAISLGNRGGTGPAADAAPVPNRVVMVESTGANAEPTVTTVTAQVTTVNGAVVALVPDGNGQVRQLTVVTATPPAGRRTSPTTPAPRSSGRPGAAGVATPATSPTSGPATAPATAAPATTGPATTATATTAPATTAPATTATATPGPVPANPGDDVATVVTGLTTLTGWVPANIG